MVSDETQKYIPPRRHVSKKDISRRQFLLGLGLLGAGTLSCGAIGTTAMLMAGEKTPAPATSIPSPEIIVHENTALPRFERPVTIRREDWGALPPNHQAVNENGFYSEDNIEGWRIYEGNLEDIYQTVIIHHSAFYEETDLQTVRAVQELQRADRGWADVAYHFFVGQTGIIYEGRDWTVRGTHVESYNTGSLGICLLGNFMVQSPTEVQLRSTQNLVNWAGERLTLSHIAGHRNFNALTECPGDNLYTYLGQFAAVAGLQIGTGGYIAPNDGAFCPCCCAKRAL